MQRTAPQRQPARCAIAFPQAESDKKVPLEVAADVKHTLGVLSMGRHADVNSSTSSFSILLGSSPHLDMRYTIFGNGAEGARGVCGSKGGKRRQGRGGCSLLAPAKQACCGAVTQNAPHARRPSARLVRCAVTKGIDVLHKLETLETRKEGIFVMPKVRRPLRQAGTLWLHADKAAAPQIE